MLLGKCMYKLNAFEVNISCNLTVLLCYLSEEPPPPSPRLPAKGKISFSAIHTFLAS